MIYKLEITEILSKIVEVEANNFMEAYLKTKQNYENERIILDENDFMDYEIKEFSNR
ncbi:DpnD/PcfM family protein [Campylobacter geochelonis]|uniref:DpnD/PcfM-like C-terminal domain-containing protein n=1 Tax=Campylobacter geochelonis TaxID=1780362 RepID=A0A128EGM4_9BACT|nr:DpnD/PcfM family protein [Campylobacter geochelonis]QKF71832.1 DpnD-PcfM domain-containing protein [Campylobacter geochelonis]CZE46972.1 Uncharacterised protein [Campylobacter geochelonis]CZE47438.1 Uncharacterised protein [Campylobacter geochelonis]CZE50937.1 Uncharacterised protein [Campylobacter geochelonis]